MHFELLHPADQLIRIMNRIYYRGMTTTSGGNLSIRDEEGNIWITPAGTDKGMLTRDDIMQVKPDGVIIGRHKPSSEYPFHLAMYRRRPDIRAIVHAHPPALVAFSIVRRLPRTDLVPDAKRICGEIAMARYALPGSQLLGENIAAEFDKGVSVVVLENHGVVAGGHDLQKAFMAFETLEYCAQLELSAAKLGTLRPLAAQITGGPADMPEFVPTYHSAAENAARRDLVRFIRRALEQGLFTSTQGTFSARTGDASLVITPDGTDRNDMDVQDLVLVRAGQREQGKMPGRSVRLHEQIYARHPNVQAVLEGCPPHIMAFAVTEAAYDPCTIPESYIMLRRPARVPFGSRQEEIAGLLSPSVPVIICENDRIITTGASLTNAFDRLEVAEFTARSIIEAKGLGDIISIQPHEIQNIITAFKLE